MSGVIVIDVVNSMSSGKKGMKTITFTVKLFVV